MCGVDEKERALMLPREWKSGPLVWMRSGAGRLMGDQVGEMRKELQEGRCEWPIVYIRGDRRDAAGRQMRNGRMRKAAAGSKQQAVQ